MLVNLVSLYALLLQLLFYNNTVINSYIYSVFNSYHFQYKHRQKYKLLTKVDNNYEIIDSNSISPLANSILDSLGIDSYSINDYNINSKNLLQELSQYLFNGTNPYYEWSSYNGNDDDDYQYKYKLRLSIGNNDMSINYTHYLIISREDINQEKQYNNDTSSLILQAATKICTNNINTKATTTMHNIRNSSYTIIPHDDYILTNANKKIHEVNASMNMLYYIKTLQQYENIIKIWISLRFNKNNTPHMITKFNLISQYIINKRVAVLIDIENVSDFRKYFYIHRNGNISFISPNVPKLVVAPLIESNVIDSKGVNRMDAKNVTHSNIVGVDSSIDSNYNTYETSGYDNSNNNKYINNKGGIAEVIEEEQHVPTSIHQDSLQNYLESSIVSQISYKNLMQCNPYLRNNLDGINLIDTRDDNTDTVRYDDYDEHCDRVLLKSDLNDDDILILAYAHTKSMLSNWANRVTTDSRKNAADSKQIHIHIQLTIVHALLSKVTNCVTTTVTSTTTITTFTSLIVTE